jgi:hypothetical protein
MNSHGSLPGSFPFPYPRPDERLLLPVISRKRESLLSQQVTFLGIKFFQVAPAGKCFNDIGTGARLQLQAGSDLAEQFGSRRILRNEFEDVKSTVYNLYHLVKNAGSKI